MCPLNLQRGSADSEGSDMARTIRVLTAKEVENLKDQGMHLVGPSGLYLQTKGDAQSWIHRYTFKGKARWSGFGSYPEMSLSGARGKLKDEQALIRQGALTRLRSVRTSGLPQSRQRQRRRSARLRRISSPTTKARGKILSIASSGRRPWRRTSIRSSERCRSTRSPPNMSVRSCSLSGTRSPRRRDVYAGALRKS